MSAQLFSFGAPRKLTRDVRHEPTQAAARKAVHELTQSADTRVLSSDEICPKRSRAIDEILARLRLRV